MNFSLLLVAAIVASLGAPVTTLAQTAPAPVANFACHTVAGSETPNATVGGRHVLCKAVDMAGIRTSFQTAMQGLNPAQQSKLDTAMRTMMKEFGFLMRYPGEYNTSEY